MRNIDERLVFINTKQYKGILKCRQTQKLRQPHKKKIVMIMLKVNNISSGEQIVIQDIEANLNKVEVFATNKEDYKSK